MEQHKYLRLVVLIMLCWLAGNVMADEDIIFYESFDKCEGTGGNDGIWSGINSGNTIATDKNGWTFGVEMGASQCMRFGTGNSNGYAITPALGLSGTAILVFKAAAWDGVSEGTNLKLSISSGKGYLSESSVTLKKGEWSTYVIGITGGNADTKVKIEPKSSKGSNRFFMDEVKVVAKVSVNVSAALYASMYYGDYALKVPEDMEAYTLTQTRDGELLRNIIYKKGEIIPKATAVVLSAPQGEYIFDISTDGEGEPDVANVLRGSDRAEQTTGSEGATDGYKFYMLSLDKEKTAGSAGFYFNKGCPNGEPFTNGAHKAYLALKTVDSADSKDFFLFSELTDAEEHAEDTAGVDDSEVTGIDHTELMPASDAPRYNLAGQRVGKGYKGIYIIRGRKVKG